MSRKRPSAWDAKQGGFKRRRTGNNTFFTIGRVAPPLNQAQLIKRAQKPEVKYFDSEASIALASNTSWATNQLDPTVGQTLFFPILGDNANQRNGKACQVLYIKLRGYLIVAAQSAQAAADSANLVRVILYEDLQTNAAQVTAATVMDTSVTGTSSLTTFQNVNNFGRFRVMKDKMWIIQDPNMVGSPTAADVTQGGKMVPFKWTFKFKRPRMVRFNATNGGTVADIVDRSWHIIGNQLSGALAATINYKCRVGYIDV